MELIAIGTVESPLDEPASAPKQGREGAPDAWLVFEARIADRGQAVPRSQPRSAERHADHRRQAGTQGARRPGTLKPETLVLRCARPAKSRT